MPANGILEKFGRGGLKVGLAAKLAGMVDRTAR